MINTIIPKNYEEWKYCITVICQQPMTRDYVEDRIKSLSDMSDFMTKKFVELYGEEQRLKTLEWFHISQKELKEI